MTMENCLFRAFKLHLILPWGSYSVFSTVPMSFFLRFWTLLMFHFFYCKIYQRWTQNKFRGWVLLASAHSWTDYSKRLDDCNFYPYKEQIKSTKFGTNSFQIEIGNADQAHTQIILLNYPHGVSKWLLYTAVYQYCTCKWFCLCLSVCARACVSLHINVSSFQVFHFSKTCGLKVSDDRGKCRKSGKSRCLRAKRVQSGKTFHCSQQMRVP